MLKSKKEEIKNYYLITMGIIIDDVKLIGSNLLLIPHGVVKWEAYNEYKFSHISTMFLIRGGKDKLNLEYISRVKNLKKLFIYNKKVKDLNFIKELSELTEVGFINNGIRDVSPLKNLKNLYSLNLRGNPIENIKSLASLTNLKFLCLEKCNISYGEILSLNDKIKNCEIDF